MSTICNQIQLFQLIIKQVSKNGAVQRNNYNGEHAQTNLKITSKALFYEKEKIFIMEI